MCDTIVYSHEVGYLKPEPAAYRIVCERLGVAPGEVLFLDDVQANVDGAPAVGMRAITFLNTKQAISNLATLPLLFTRAEAPREARTALGVSEWRQGRINPVHQQRRTAG